MFRKLFDIAPDAMIAVDGLGNIVQVNEQAERLFGFPASELRGATIETLIPQRARAAHTAHLVHYTANPRVRSMGSGQELTGLRRDGSEFSLEIALSPVKGPDGQLYVASIRDVSETQRARQVLVRARHDNAMAHIGQLILASPDLDGAIESIPEWVATALDVQGVVLIFKHVLHERMQIRASFGVPGEVLDVLIESLPYGSPERLFAEGQPMMLDFSLPTSGVDGGDVFLKAGFASTTMIPLFDPTKPIGALLVFSQESRSFDHDAVHFLQSVANMLASAIQRIRTEEQLSHAQRLEAIGQLTGGIAHDFNNLLTIISGNLQILEDELRSRPAMREIINGALRAVDRGAELTRRLLAFARRQQLSPRACDAKELLQELGVMLRRLLGDAIELQIVCPTDMPNLFVDPGQLDAALINLAINARDAMPRGGRLSITASLHDEPNAPDNHVHGSCVAIAVRDTGMGMSPEVLARAFEPFFTTKEHDKGSGLGLSMVHGFVNQSGGHLTMDSKLGYGTCVELHLPATSYKQEPRDSCYPSRAARGHETILVVEDEADVRHVALTFLRSFGYKVLTAENAEEALTLLADTPEIGLVFSDVTLGSGMTGVELAHELRRMRSGLPVLLTSGDERSVQDDTDDMDAFDLLRKPYRREILSAAVRRLLDHREIH